MNGACFVAGCGSIGRRHIRNLRTLGADPVYAFDSSSERLHGAVQDLGVGPCRSFEDGLSRRPALVLICTPPHQHVEMALNAVEAGSHVFVEKPLSDSLDGTDKLLAATAKAGRSLHVGYNWRFHPGLRRIYELLSRGDIGDLLTLRAEFGQYLPDWRPDQDYRTSYTALAYMGGGIVRDASHEVDYVCWLAGEVRGVYCLAGKFSNLEMDVEDTAEITLRLSSPAVAQIHVDCTQRAYTRNCKLIGTAGTLVWDYADGIRKYDSADKTWRHEPVLYDANFMYLAELGHVLACVRGEQEVEVTGETGKRVLRIVLAALESARTRREVAL